MVSIIFFIFVALILVAGFLAATWKRKNKIPLDTDVRNGGNGQFLSRSNSSIDEGPTRDIKGGIVPADNKLSQEELDEENDNDAIL